MQGRDQTKEDRLELKKPKISYLYQDKTRRGSSTFPNNKQHATPSQRAQAHETHAVETTIHTIYHVLYTILQSF